MHLQLNDSQNALQMEARAYLSKSFRTQKSREVEAGPEGFSKDVWEVITGQGWPAAATDRFLRLCVLAEELGRAGASTPLIVNYALAATVIEAATASSYRDELLEHLYTGERLVTAALIEEAGRNERTPPSLSFAENEDGGTLSGVKLLVPYAASASVILTSARAENGGVILVAVENGSDGLSATRHKTTGADPLFRLHFDNVNVSSKNIIARENEADAALSVGLDGAAVVAIAEAVGFCEAIISLTVERAKTREQFGAAIGSFQAVSHPIADMRIETDAVRLLALEAAWKLDQGEAASFEAASAKAFANEVCGKIAMDSHRLQGAIGYSNEYDLQLFTRRARAFCLAYGDTDDELERAAAALGL